MSGHSIVPFLMEGMVDPMVRRWNNFGLGIHPNELETFHSAPMIHRSGYHHWPLMREMRGMREMQHDGNEIVRSTIGKDGFQVCLDVHQFAPNEITVKTMDDTNTIVVEAKHEERQDEHGHISRQFARRYDLPKGFLIKDVVSQLSSDGILTIKAPPPVIESKKGHERVVQIQHTGPAHLTVGNMEAIKKDGEKGSQKNGK